MKKITLFFSAMFFLVTCYGQLSLQTGTATYNINFNGTVSGVNAGAYAGTGFSNSPSSGQLDADAWSTTGFSDGSKGFGAARTSGDHARGFSTGNVSSGGLYSFDVGGGNRALGVQPTGSDWTPGTITLKIVNNSNAVVTSMNLSYSIYSRNDQSRASTFNLSHSTNNSSYTSVAAANYTSPQASGNSNWTSTNRSTQIAGLNLDPGAAFYIRWSSSDAGGSGSRDELALDNISITTTSSGGGGNGGGGNTGYYASIGNETCGDLKTALYNLIKGHSKKSYASLWTHYKTTDDRRNDSNTETIIWDMYSDNPTGPENEFSLGSDQCGTFAGEGSCYNREHTFPKSWWGGSTSPSQYTDIFTVVPSDGWVNSVRNNYPYGEVLAGTENQITNNGSKLGNSAITIPGYTGKVFEPTDAYKGDLARGYFYMATRYENVIASWENITPEANVVLDGSSFPVYEPWLINMLIDWHNSDPVSQKEIDRNESIFGIQGNRNPFIDHPEYVDLIWGSCGNNGGGGSPTVLHEANFESGWDGWSDGGGDCARTSSSRSPQGNYSIYIRDNSGASSAMTSPSFDLRGYNSVQVDFSFYAHSMETNEDFWMSYYNGSSYQVVKAYKRGTDFNNGSIYNFSITIDDNNYNFVSNAKFRFQCDASSNADLIYMDEIVITGVPAGNAYQANLTPAPTAVADELDKAITSEKATMEQRQQLINTNLVTIYPNPVSDFVFLDLRKVSAPVVTVEIYNLTGQKVLPSTNVATGGIFQKELTTLTSGMYFLRVIDANQVLKTEKIFVK